MKEVIYFSLRAVLDRFYEYCFITLLISVMATYIYIHIKRNGWRSVVREWVYSFKDNKEFRLIFCFVAYTTLVLLCTLFCREFQPHPFDKMLGSWTFHDKNGKVTTDQIENFVLFVPYSFLLCRVFKDKLFGKRIRLLDVIWKSFLCCGGFSLAIELCQVLFRLGLFQLTDLIFNTMGGMFGGIIFYIWSLCHRDRSLDNSISKGESDG